MIQVGEHYFELLVNHKEGFNLEQFKNRYSEVLDRYPYIVGDIGFEQLRLRGFVEDNKKNSEVNKRFSTILDYIYESCNFGCAYFVLRRLNASEVTKLKQPETITDVPTETDSDYNEFIQEEVHQTEQQVELITEEPIKVPIQKDEQVDVELLSTDQDDSDVDNKTFKYFLK
ncbi:DUF1027 domain-containing protein [Macrococcus sp. DPC7161]|nr:DUF1027 domain-containing protein [Macrococcus sp. DPC7161]